MWHHYRENECCSCISHMNMRHPPLSQSTLTANEAVGHFAVALPSDLRNVNTTHITHAASHHTRSITPHTHHHTTHAAPHHTRSITNTAAVTSGTSINTHCNPGDGAAARVGIPDADAATSSGILNLKRFIYRPERRAAAFRYVGLC